MDRILKSPSLNLLRNSIDFRRVPFSDRGSRLMVFLKPEENILYIRLAERLTSVEPGFEAYLRRPPFIHDLSFVDEHGQPLEYQVESYPHALYFTTRLGNFGLAFQDNRTLAIGLPSGVAAGVHFHVSPQYWRESPNGGVFKSVRNLAYATNGEAIQNRITPERGGYTVDFIVQAGDDGSILLNIGSVLSQQWDVLPFSQVSEASERRWQDWFASVPPVNEKYRKSYTYAWWVMANNLIQPQGPIAYESMMPSKVNYVGLWLWDSAMHALAYRHVNPDLARNQIRSMIACQLPNGMLPDAVYDEGVISEIDHPIRAGVTKPPILAWAALKLHETDPDLDFLQEIYVPLVRWNAWWFSMNDDDVDGLVQYNHPYSSGLDNNPLWDYGMPVESPDLNTYLCVQMGSLAVIAEKLGMDAEAAMWHRRSRALVERMIEHFWDENAGVFRALHENQPIPVITPFNLYPLWTGQLPERIRKRLLDHLLDPEMFWGDCVIPSVARNDPHFDPESMWRGPVWVNINYIFIEALRQIGENDLALELTGKTLDLVASHPSMYEYYNSVTGEPAPLAADAFGWTAAVFIDLAVAMSQEKEKKVAYEHSRPESHNS